MLKLLFLTVCTVPGSFLQSVVGLQLTNEHFQRNICPGKCILLTEESPDCSPSLANKFTGISEVCQEYFKGKFKNAEECEKKCYGCPVQEMLSKCGKDEILTKRDKFAACRLKPETGRCRAHFVMWYYNVRLKSCKTFVYGGCGGNGNKFDSHLKCLLSCGLLAFPIYNRGNHDEL